MFAAEQIRARRTDTPKQFSGSMTAGVLPVQAAARGERACPLCRDGGLPSAQAGAVDLFNTSEFSPALRLPLPPAPVPPAAVPPPIFVLTRPSARGTRVLVFDARTGQELFSFVPFAGFHGRVRVAVGDVNDDGILDVIAGSGPGGPGRVVVVNGRTHGVLDKFRPVGASFRRDVAVAAGDVNRDGFADVLVLTRRHHRLLAEVFDSKALARGQAVLLGIVPLG